MGGVLRLQRTRPRERKAIPARRISQLHHALASPRRPAPEYWHRPPALYLAFRFFSRAALLISLYSSINLSSLMPQDAIISSRSFAAARMASNSALRLRFCAGM